MAETGGNYLNLTVLAGILEDPLIAAFAAYRNSKTAAAKTAFLRELFDKGAESNFAAYVGDAVIRDDNAFSRACAAGRDLTPYLKEAYIADLAEIGRALDFESSEFGIGNAPFPIKSWDGKAANLLYSHYQSAGYGKFLSGFEFRYDRDEGLVPILRPRALPPAALKGYDRERETVTDNLENFVKGLPCSDMLLYGGSGTGKSALLSASASAFASQKLRLVRLDRSDIRELPRVMDGLAALSLRFLIVIEALSEEIHPAGCAADNVLIAATGHVRLNGFGLTVRFAEPDLEGYLAIVRELLRDYKVKLPQEDADALAREWAETHGCTPRSADRLAGYLSACQKKGKEIRL